MIGYGNEDDNFVIELTYNYGIHSYDRGNDFLGITIQDGEILKRAREFKWPIADGNVLEAPGGYKYYIVDKDQPSDKGLLVDKFKKIFLRNIRCLKIKC